MDVIEADLSVAAPFAAQLRDTFGFETDMKHFAIFGRCATCAAEAEAGDPKDAAATSGPGE
jgi:Fur family ferric uptake transcriptional regulator